ncbi:MAG TPA: CoA-transferase [Anaerolineales bacterium]|nr:CoA-transferase [Anaerolineales bacterium]
MRRDKRVSMPEAVGLIPGEGGVIALGGTTLYRRPMAFSLALRAQFLGAGRPHGLTLLCFTAGLESDLLVGAGMVQRVRTCYFGLEAFGFAPAFTEAVHAGRLEVIEESEASLAMGIRARMAGIGFMPSAAWIGTDMPSLRPDVRTVIDPYSGEELMAFPAIGCDTAIIHALEADREGNAAIGRHWGLDHELSLVAETVIVTAERLVDRLEEADIVAPAVDAVVETPRGAWPTSCYPQYPLDGRSILAYQEAAGTPALDALLASWANAPSPS